MEIVEDNYFIEKNLRLVSYLRQLKAELLPYSQYKTFQTYTDKQADKSDFVITFESRHSSGYWCRLKYYPIIKGLFKVVKKTKKEKSYFTKGYYRDCAKITSLSFALESKTPEHLCIGIDLEIQRLLSLSRENKSILDGGDLDYFVNRHLNDKPILTQTEYDMFREAVVKQAKELIEKYS